MSETIPQPIATLDVATEDGAVIRLRRHGNPRGNRLIVSHGNGFASDGYIAFWGRFLGDCEIVLFDARNHGWNPPSEPAHHDYPHMARDLELVRAAAAAEFGTKPTAGVFHSMSAQAAMLAARDIAWRFDALVLFDPPNYPAAGHPVRPAMLSYLERLVAWASARRDHFDDPSGLARDYAATRAGRNWAAGTHQQVAEAVLRPAALYLAAGGWELRCPRALEAAMYRAGISLDLWPKASDFAGPLKLIGGDPDRERPDPTALSNRALAQEGGFDYLAIPGTGHLLQLEAPQACVEAVRAFLSSAGMR